MYAYRFPLSDITVLLVYLYVGCKRPMSAKWLRIVFVVMSTSSPICLYRNRCSVLNWRAGNMYSIARVRDNTCMRTPVQHTCTTCTCLYNLYIPVQPVHTCTNLYNQPYVLLTKDILGVIRHFYSVQFQMPSHRFHFK